MTSSSSVGRPLQPTASLLLEHLMSFGKLCGILEAVLNAATKQAKLHILDSLWLAVRKAADEALAAAAPDPAAQSLAAAAATNSFHTFLRLLCPQLDTARSTYGLKESKIALHYIDLFGLPPNSADAIRLRQWRDPSKNSVDVTHFSDVAYIVLIKRGYQTAAGAAPLSVDEVNTRLDRLAACADNDRRREVLSDLMRSLSATEHKWLIRIIMKEMRMQIMHQGILAAFHPNALETFNVSNDLRFVCEKCTDPNELSVTGDTKAGIFLHQPLKPMLASVVETAKLQTLLRGDEAQPHRIVTEPKYDGERMMIHVSDSKISYWTRNAKNFTMHYGPRFDSVLRSCLRSPDVSNCILDGEFMVYDDTVKALMPFGSNRTLATAGAAFSETVDGVKRWFCYFCFDIVFRNGESLVATPLLARKDILASTVRPKATMLELVPHALVPPSGIRGILSALDAALMAGQEGVMIKAGQSHYVPGERRLKWLKLKPDHISGMSDTLDLIILGGYYGTKYGERRVSHFLLAAWAPRGDPKATVPVATPSVKDARAQFVTVAKVGSGYTDNDLRDIDAVCGEKWLTLPRGVVPPWLGNWKPAADDVPDVYLHPNDALVMEVIGYSFTETTKFSLGHTIRFPRCSRLRFDKTTEDATDVEQIRSIMSGTMNRLRKAEEMEELVMTRTERLKRRRDEERDKRAAAAASSHRGTSDAARVFFATDFATSITRSADARRGESEDALVKRLPFVKKEEKEHVVDSSAYKDETARVMKPDRAAVGSSHHAATAHGVKVEKQEDDEKGASWGATPHLSANDKRKLLAGYEVCLLGTSPTDVYSRGEIERLVLHFGGAVVALPQSTTSLIVSSSVGAARVQNWIRECSRRPVEMQARYGRTDVIKLSWLFDCFEHVAVLPLTPRCMWYTSPATQALFDENLDRFQDSYFDDATMETFVESIELARRELAPPSAAGGGHTTTHSRGGDVLAAMSDFDARIDAVKRQLRDEGELN